ncbi:hypothetical protein, partial [Jannaschia marina]|uniref:hypothetical protein n=1 Tax=Jannaschia marina TaxID=2741674 RepID=UPI001F2696BD
ALNAAACRFLFAISSVSFSKTKMTSDRSSRQRPISREHLMHQRQDESDGGEVVARELVVAVCGPSEVFHAVEEALDGDCSARRCHVARTMVQSMNRTDCGNRSARHSNTAIQTPRLTQRLKGF